VACCSLAISSYVRRCLVDLQSNHRLTRIYGVGTTGTAVPFVPNVCPLVQVVLPFESICSLSSYRRLLPQISHLLPFSHLFCSRASLNSPVRVYNVQYAQILWSTILELAVMSSNYLQSTQQPTDFRPSSDRVCTACNEARVDQYPAVRYCNVKAGRRPCLPYSQIDDTLLPNCGLQNLQHGLDTALIYGSYDSPLVPESQLLAQHGREHELQSRGMTSTTGRSDPKRRPVILFPKKKAVKKQFACLMGTFDGGYIYGRTTRSFAYGVWPTIVDPLHGLGSHIHTTPRWESARSEEGNELPQFVLAIEYKPDHCDKPWRHSVTYHLDAGTTEFLSTLCIQMVRKWVRETSSAPVSSCRIVVLSVLTFDSQGSEKE
jgi:hypothetical protein